jgi:hypothetical protein
LQEPIAHFYPNATYTASLDAEVRERAARRQFQPPQVRQSLKYPHCGALNASIMDETFAFVCQHCGASVTVEPRQVQ